MSDSKLPEDTKEYIKVAHIGSAYGLKGWVNIISYTQPKTNIIEYSPWYLRSVSPSAKDQYQLVKVEQIRKHGKGIVAQLPSCTDRTQAELYKNTEIAILRSQLPEQANDEYYWHDLIGLNVVTADQVKLGEITDLMETGANDVLVVTEKVEDKTKTRLVPFIRPEVVTSIDLMTKLVVVDWDPDF
ncbi:16S rRNA processing protein RimM [hydrothermal vent metagenome]|uniref:16S rRNA processing protein RimM n=1 Tax=hydrothermal vent metagenome TaxID=652676 RepID=A0A3B0ZL63_9ZZZZ